jgi:hypothetical protein
MNTSDVIRTTVYARWLLTGLLGCGVGAWLGMSQCEALRQCGGRMMQS